VSVRRPFAYVLPADRVRVAEHLRLHNIAVETMEGDATLPCETYHILAREATSSPDVGTETRTETVFWVRAERGDVRVRKGDFVVRMAQPLANVAIYLLEPHSDDGLARWGFFDDLKAGDVYPVRRVAQAAGIPSR
jgi:hypothetical protein